MVFGKMFSYKYWRFEKEANFMQNQILEKYFTSYRFFNCFELYAWW